MPELGVTFAQAHNSYLELAVELGIPAASLLVLIFVFIIALNYSGAQKTRQDAVAPPGAAPQTADSAPKQPQQAAVQPAETTTPLANTNR